MKKRVLSVISLVVVLATLLITTGCGGKSIFSDQEKFAGKWQGSVDLTEFLKEEMEASLADAADYFDFKDFKIAFNFTFNSDGTYSIALDEDTFSDTYDSFIADFSAGTRSYLEDTLKEAGLDESVDEYLKETMDCTFDEFIDQTADKELNKDTLIKSFDGLDGDGNFKAAEGKLYMDSDKEYVEYEFVSDDECKLNKAVGDNVDEINKMMFPMTLKKIG